MLDNSVQVVIPKASNVDSNFGLLRPTDNYYILNQCTIVWLVLDRNIKQ